MVCDKRQASKGVERPLGVESGGYAVALIIAVSWLLHMPEELCRSPHCTHS